MKDGIFQQILAYSTFTLVEERNAFATMEMFILIPTETLHRKKSLIHKKAWKMNLFRISDPKWIVFVLVMFKI